MDGHERGTPTCRPSPPPAPVHLGCALSRTPGPSQVRPLTPGRPRAGAWFLAPLRSSSVNALVPARALRGCAVPRAPSGRPPPPFGARARAAAVGPTHPGPVSPGCASPRPFGHARGLLAQFHDVSARGEGLVALQLSRLRLDEGEALRAPQSAQRPSSEPPSTRTRYAPGPHRLHPGTVRPPSGPAERQSRGSVLRHIPFRYANIPPSVQGAYICPSGPPPPHRPPTMRSPPPHTPANPSGLRYRSVM
ncbi:hypothetical protein YW7DRAFT_01123 [Streptomyces sp. AmelKG-E11A]|nr:hypothetical protein YW7DRAFT_01123 [Streptomyces sp. AmelKG-E11A]